MKDYKSFLFYFQSVSNPRTQKSSDIPFLKNDVPPYFTNKESEKLKETIRSLPWSI